MRRRWLNATGALVCVLGLCGAYYAQFFLGIEPCPLCIFQRIALFALGLLFMTAALHHPRGWGSPVYGTLIAICSAMGAGIAGRQLWLQHLPPDQVPRCGPGLDYLLESFPFWDVLREVLSGSGECAKVDIFWGISIPIWTLCLFVGVGLLGSLCNRRPSQRIA